VLIGALVTAGAALLPDVDQPSSTIANSGGMITRSVAAVAGTLSGGHRHGTHSILAIAAFTFGTVMAARVPLPVLRELMGHADVQTTLRYVDVGEDQKRDAIAAVFGSGVAATWQQNRESGAAVS